MRKSRNTGAEPPCVEGVGHCFYFVCCWASHQRPVHPNKPHKDLQLLWPRACSLFSFFLHQKPHLKNRISKPHLKNPHLINRSLKKPASQKTASLRIINQNGYCFSINTPQVPQGALLLPYRRRTDAPDSIPPSALFHHNSAGAQELVTLHSRAIFSSQRWIQGFFQVGLRQQPFGTLGPIEHEIGPPQFTQVQHCPLRFDAEKGPRAWCVRLQPDRHWSPQQDTRQHRQQVKEGLS